MHVLVSPHDGRPHAAVVDVDDLTRLAVLLDGVDVVSAATALSDQGLGDVDGDHAWLVVDRLRLAGPDDADWTDRFAAMIRYAAGRGWVDGTGTRVRAHLETGTGPRNG